MPAMEWIQVMSPANCKWASVLKQKTGYISFQSLSSLTMNFAICVIVFFFIKFPTTDIAFLAFWLVHLISVGATFVWPWKSVRNLFHAPMFGKIKTKLLLIPAKETDCVMCCHAGNWLALISKVEAFTIWWKFNKTIISFALVGY